MPLHPQVRTFLDQLAAQNAPDWSEMPPDEARQIFATLRPIFGSGPKLAQVEDHDVAGRFSVRVFRPHEDAVLPVILYFHGGGWVLGDLDTHDTLCRRLAHGSQCAVVSVDYRKAPEHKFPAALDDCFDATLFVSEHAEELRFDRSRIAVGGDSAGGNLAIGVALRCRERQLPRIRHQLLLYPVIEPNFDSGSYLDYAEGYGLTRDSMAWFWRQYLGEDLAAADPYAVPSAADLAGLPPAHVVVAEYDVLRSEVEGFIDQLRGAGVETTVEHYPGMIHGFVHFSGAFDTGRDAAAEMSAVVKAALE